MRYYPFVLAGFIPILLYFTWVSLFSVNVPQLDDFDAILTSVKKLHEAGSLSETTNILLGFHNEHRIAYTRGIAWLVSILSGGPVDLRILIILGNLALLGIGWLLYKSFRRTGLYGIYFLPIPFLLFQMQFFENTFFAMAALQNLSVWCWAGWALWLLVLSDTSGRRQWWYFNGALGLALLTTFTSGNGIGVWLAGAAIFLLRGSWSKLAAWLSASYLTAHLYFRHSPIILFDGSANLSEIFQSGFGYIGAFIGTGFPGGILVPTLAGFLITAITFTELWTVTRRSKGANSPLDRFEMQQYAYFWLAFFLFLLSTALAVAVSRSSFAAASVPRYKIGSAIALILFYQVTINTFRGRLFRHVFTGLFLLGSILFCGLTYQRNTPKIIDNRALLLLDARDFKNDGRLHNPLYEADAFHPETAWQEAIDAGVF